MQTGFIWLMKGKCDGFSVPTRGAEAGRNYRGPGPDYVAYVCVFLGSIIICRL
jgi:hypothetical protein